MHIDRSIHRNQKLSVNIGLIHRAISTYKQEIYKLNLVIFSRLSIISKKKNNSTLCQPPSPSNNKVGLTTLSHFSPTVLGRHIVLVETLGSIIFKSSRKISHCLLLLRVVQIPCNLRVLIIFIAPLVRFTLVLHSAQLKLAYKHQRCLWYSHLTEFGVTENKVKTFSIRQCICQFRSINVKHYSDIWHCSVPKIGSL